MKSLKRFFLAMLVTTVATAVSAEGNKKAYSQDENAHSQGCKNAFAAERARSHMAFLADDLLEGRETGTRGFDVAAAYVAQQFAALGLEPAGDANTYFQRVPLGRWPQEQAVMVADGTSFKLNIDFVVHRRAGPGAFNISGQAVFVGYGFDAPELGFDNYSDIDVEGKIAVMMRPAPKGIDRALAALLSAKRAAFAAKHGAIGVFEIILPSETASFKERSQSRADMLALMIDDELDALKPGSVDAIPTIFISSDAATEIFSPAGLDVEEMERAHLAGGALSKVGALGQTVLVSGEGPQSRFTSPNVLARFPGADPALSQESIIITSHLDHLGRGEPVDGDDIYNGAQDNASGIATLLQIAHFLAHTETRPKRSIILMATTGEERGMLGARYFAARPTIATGKVVANFNIDGAARILPTTEIWDVGGAYSDLGFHIKRAAEKTSLDYLPDPAPESNMIMRSDQVAFVLAGVPGAFTRAGIASAGYSSDEIDEVYAEAPYHTPNDDMNFTYDYETMVTLARFGYNLALELGDLDKAPEWNKDYRFLIAPEGK